MKERLWHQHKWPSGMPHEMVYPSMPLHRILEDAAQKYPSKPFMLFDDTIVTYLQANETANRVANFLVAAGIRNGDRVAMMLPNIPHFPIIFFGALKAGAICITSNPMYTASELNFQLNNSGARCLFVFDHPVIYPTACEAIRDTTVETVVYCNIGRYLPLWKRLLGQLSGKIPHAETHDDNHILFDKILAGRSTAPPDIAISPQEDLVSIQYTGGTTGKPKGVCLTHANLVSNLTTAQAWVRPGEDPEHAEQMLVGGECFMGLLPWFHSYGLVMTLLATVRLTSSVVCVPEPSAGSPPFTDMLKLINKHHVTVFNGVPALFSTLINHPLIDQFDLHSLKLCGCGAAPLSVELAQRFEEKTGAILYEAYGLTETATMAMCNPTNRVERKLGTLGIPVPNTDAILVDLETGLHEMPPGEEGEIAISGPQVMKGYWNRPDEDEEVFRQFNGTRYLLTSDIGCMDKEGFFTLLGRKDDMFIVNGFNVYPSLVEEVLLTHPGVSQAVVIGIPHKRTGEAGKAFIVLKDGATTTKRELILYCKERLAGYKVPRIIEFRNELPVTLKREVNRKQLKQEELAKAASETQAATMEET